MADGDLKAQKQALQEQIQQAQGALSRIKALSDEYWHALDSASQAMSADAWFGPMGRQFGSAVQTHRAELQGELSKAVTSAQRKVEDLQNKLRGLR